MSDVRDQKASATLLLLEAGYKLRNSYKLHRDEHPKPEEEQPIKRWDVQGKVYWTKSGSIDPLIGDEALRAADLYARWRNYFMAELPFHPAYFPDERERTTVQEAMTKWRKDLDTQCGQLVAQSRDLDPLLRLVRESRQTPYAGQLYPKLLPSLQELGSERLSEVLEQHVRHLADDAERLSGREALLMQCDFDLPAIFKRAKGERTYQEVADDMGRDIETVTSWALGRRHPERENRKIVSDWVLKALMPSTEHASGVH